MASRHDAADANSPTISLGPPAAPAGPFPSRPLPRHVAGRYRPVRLHARGGVGELYLAADDELERDVALKRMRDAPAGDPVGRERFFREARITGRLQHPGIVPVYGLGHDSAGRPCYAMRFVEGESLAEAIRRYHTNLMAADGSPPLTLRQLLQRFVAACNAVAYAHSRGIIHRDLKPQNIMLGRYGETLVVDWGLAKSICDMDSAPPANGPEEATGPNAKPVPEAWIDDADPPPSNHADLPTSPTESARTNGSIDGSSPAGTPAFMSPEQAAGRWESVGAASDVYSLGATLFVLLTGEVPFPGDDLDEILDTVQLGRVPLPRLRNADVPPALEAICLRAMARDPAERYASALDLAADIERWLADEAVSAYRDSWQGSFRRWGRRHPAFLGGVVSAVIILLAGLSAATLWLGAARQREQWLREHAEIQERQTQQERDEAARQAALAGQQRDRAAESFRLARNAVDQILNDAGLQSLRDVPQVEPVRLQLLEKALQFHQAFLKQSGDDPTVREDAAEAQGEVADLYRQMGRLDEGIKEYDAALVAFTALSQAYPNTPRHRRKLAQLFNNLSLTQSALGRTADAETSIRRSLAYTEALIREQPEERSHRIGLAKNYHNLGSLQRSTNRLADAEASFQRSLEIGAGLLRETPDDEFSRLDQGKHHQVLASLLIDTNRVGEAEGHVRQAVTMLESLVRDHPAPPEFRRTQVLVYVLQARLAGASDGAAPAEEALHKALAVSERLVREFPYIPDYQSQHIDVFARLNKLLLSTKRGPDLVAMVRREADAREAAAMARADQPVEFIAQAAAICNNGVTLAEIDEHEPAIEQYTRAIRLLENPRVAALGDARSRQFLRNCYGNRALEHKALDSPTAALDDWRHAIDCSDDEIDRSKLRINSIWALMKQADYRSAAQTARAADTPELPAADGLAAAATLASCAGKAGRDESLEFTDRLRYSREFSDRAIAILVRFRSDSYMKSPTAQKQLQTDQSFDSIRNRDEFRNLLTGP